MIIRFLLLFAIALQAGCQKGDSNWSLDSEAKKQAYAIGLKYGQNLRLQDESIDIESWSIGAIDGYRENKPALDETEINVALQSMLAKRRATIAAEMIKRSKANAEFMTVNTKNGYKASERGVQFKVLKAGEGKKPAATSIVTLKYTAKLIDGKEVETTAGQTGGVQDFKIKDLVPGLRDVVANMPVGSRWSIVIPPDQAYGERGNAKVPPTSIVIFDVELQNIR